MEQRSIYKKNTLNLSAGTVSQTCRHGLRPYCYLTNHNIRNYNYSSRQNYSKLPLFYIHKPKHQNNQLIWLAGLGTVVNLVLTHKKGSWSRPQWHIQLSNQTLVLFWCLMMPNSLNCQVKVSDITWLCESSVWPINSDQSLITHYLLFLDVFIVYWELVLITLYYFPWARSIYLYIFENRKLIKHVGHFQIKINIYWFQLLSIWFWMDKLKRNHLSSTNHIVL